MLNEAHKWRHNSDKENGVVEDLTLFQARKQVFLKHFLKQNFGVHFSPVSLRTRLCCLNLAELQ